MEALKNILLTTLIVISSSKASFSQTDQVAVGSNTAVNSQGQTRTQLKFINNAFENASPFNWEIDSSGAVVISLIYDRERSSPNRANQHWHFQVQATAGSDLT